MDAPCPLPPSLIWIADTECDSSQKPWLFTTTRVSANCPDCQNSSSRIHGYYYRTLADLPYGGETVSLQALLRRFFCDNPLCSRKTFAEPITDFARRYARRTERLRMAQTSIGQFVGSRPGKRLARQLAMPTSDTTLLRMERAVPLPVHPTPRVLGVDDWAFRRGHNYGTILYDMERRVVVDLLPDRTQETLATWLKEHPGVEIVSRDRAEAYASGIRQGAPEAQQVADRWHLAKNLGQTLEKLLETKGTLLKQALNSDSEGTSPDNNPPTPPKVETSEPEAARQTRQEERLQLLKQSRRQSRLEQYEEVRTLYAEGWTISSISRYLNLSRKTVRDFVTASVFPERKERSPRVCQIDAYKPYITERWREGCHNGAALHEEIRQRGYRGGYTTLKDYLRSLRKMPDPSQVKPREKASPRQVAFWMLKRAGDRTARQQSILDSLSQLCVPFQVASRLASRFLEMIRQCPRTDQSATFREWLADAQKCGVAEIVSFATSLKQDQSAVEAGLSLPWSNGVVEGSNNRLKYVKRRGYGRANFDLLRRRVLQST